MTSGRGKKRYTGIVGPVGWTEANGIGGGAAPLPHLVCLPAVERPKEEEAQK